MKDKMCANFIFLLILSIVSTGLMIWAVYCEMPCMSAVLGILVGVSIVFTLALGAGCALTEEYNYAMIKLPDGTVVEGGLDYYFDSNDVAEVTIDGIQYKVSQENCVLISRGERLNGQRKDPSPVHRRPT